MKKRVEWTGETRSLRYVMEFLGEDFESVTEPAFIAFEKDHPGEVEKLYCFMYENEDDWLSNQVELNDVQIKALQVYIDCVNDWYQKEAIFFKAMDALWAYNQAIDEWDPKDRDGLKAFMEAYEWWHEERNSNIIVSDIQYRMESLLGEDSLLYQKHLNFTYDELLEIYNNFYFARPPYDLELIGFNGDEVLDVPEEETKKIMEFLILDSFLPDLKYASERHAEDLAKKNLENQ